MKCLFPPYNVIYDLSLHTLRVNGYANKEPSGSQRELMHPLRLNIEECFDYFSDLSPTDGQVLL